MQNHIFADKVFIELHNFRVFWEVSRGILKVSQAGIFDPIAELRDLVVRAEVFHAVPHNLEHLFTYFVLQVIHHLQLIKTISIHNAE